jgi:hypothetical protein
MRKLTMSIFFLAVLALIFVTGGKTAAAPGGFTAADLKGRYVGHYNGGRISLAGPSAGIISIDADGIGSATVVVLDQVFVGSTTCSYSVSSNGQVTCSAGTLTIEAFLSDRGKSLDFWFNDSSSVYGAGAASIQ